MRHCCTAAARMFFCFFMILACLIAVSGCSPGGKSIFNSESGGIPKVTTEYQAVFLDNGQAFIGKLENAGSKYPLLKDVYYIQSQQDPTTKQVNSVLTKRGSELHGPDVMFINASHILIVESVTTGSKVAQLIEESKAKK
jgi:hypothetical protein